MNLDRVGRGGDESSEAGAAVVLGLLVPPQIPAEVVERLAAELPEALSERVSDRVCWKVPTIRDSRVPDAEGGDDGGEETIDDVQAWRRHQGWDLAVCITDPPLVAGRRAVVAETSSERDVALLSVPALGAIRRRRRAREAVVRLVAETLGEHLGLGREDEGRSGERSRRLRLPAHTGLSLTEHVETGEGDGSLYLVASAGRGRLWLLAGMLRQNRPFRFILDLTYALAAALGTAAFALVSDTIWIMADGIGWTRLAVLMVVSVAVMVVWLIAVHDLWERPAGKEDRQRTLLFNATTVITLTLGASSLYAVLFVLTLATAGFLIAGGVLGGVLGHPIGPGDYVALTWMTASLATLGGTLGSGLETSGDVRDATYTYHRERRGEDGSQ